MFRVSDLEISAQMDVSIILPLLTLSRNLKNWIQNDTFFRKGNFVELILVVNAQNRDKIKRWIFQALPANISVIFVDSGSIADFYQYGIRKSSNNNILLITPDYIESNVSLLELLRLKLYYSNSYIYSAGLTNAYKQHVAQSILVSKVDIQEIKFGNYVYSNTNQFFDSVRVLLGQFEKIEIKTDEICNNYFPKTFIKTSIKQFEIHAIIEESNDSIDPFIKPTTNIKQINKKFKKLIVYPPQKIKNKHNIICLLQVKNEALIIKEALDHFSEHFDGIILLDDGSTDKTFEIATTPKLLCKAQKKNINKGFNDLENRNLLLEMAFFFKSDWLIFLDADERLHHKYDNLKDILQRTQANVLEFKCVHLWDSAEKYRVDIPEGSNGLMSRCRMFRHKGWMQIYSNREIYFTAVPFVKNTKSVPIIILHYGLIDRTVRKRKYDLYKAQDIDGKKQGYDYEYLLDDDPALADIELIKLSTDKVI
ncbi:MAG: glycosyltransferase family 2 protein [Sediminibacterium sp.]|uniref:glycosyltransferase family 2 protein n=1 Tax=Sediminibacterium sp. TaxID=1917865 RepID=UPI0027264633|nr:glycosyltransferase family 2 protein [Sediminibacterium sp.]MDO8997837.1 glycosyltransferase family 2 protein [Sediminibacterium sp.]